MSAFYIPVGEARNGVRKLWCRCASCLWSGPVAAFVLYNRFGEMMEICIACNPSEDEWLRVEGWEAR